MSTVLSGSAQPGAAAGLYSHSSQPYIQRLGIAGVSIQRLQAVPTPCRPLERAVPVPCQRAGIAAQARARGRAVLGTGTGEAGRAVFVPGQISIVPVLARWAWPVWKSLAACMTAWGETETGTRPEGSLSRSRTGALRADRSVQCSASFMPVARQVSRQGLPNRDVSYSSGSLMFMLKYYWKKIQFYD